MKISKTRLTVPVEYIGVSYETVAGGKYVGRHVKDAKVVTTIPENSRQYHNTTQDCSINETVPRNSQQCYTTILLKMYYNIFLMQRIASTNSFRTLFCGFIS